MPTRLVLPFTTLLFAALAVGQEPAFKGGFPAADQAQAARDDADFQHAVTAYRFWYPTVSCEGIFDGRPGIVFRRERSRENTRRRVSWPQHHRRAGAVTAASARKRRDS